MARLTDLTLAAARAALTSRACSARELTEAYLAAMERGRGLNCFITATPERARAMADAADTRLARGDAGLLEGIPLGIKDLYCTAGVRTTAASRILDNFIPPYESTVTANLWAAGAVMLGKVNMDEFAMGTANIHSAYGPVISPWSGADPTTAPRQLVPGGSSGGSAAAVAARLVLGATASDTGGSIRQPAALTGTVGIKPTYGRCSRFGMVAFASSLDQAGPIARTVEDCALLLRAMAGFDAQDSTSVNVPVPDYTVGLDGDLRGLRIGIPRDYRLDALQPEIAALWDRAAGWLRAAGAETLEIRLPNTAHALAAYYIIAPAEASSNLARYDGMRYGVRVAGQNLQDTYEQSRGQGFGREVRRRILIGTYVLSAGYYDAYYRKAQQVRSLIAGDFTQAFHQCDAILTPATPGPAFAIGEKQDDPVQMYLEDVFTVPVNLAGLPGLSVPGGLNSAGLPLGLQVIGRPFDEETVLRVGRAVELAADLGDRLRPPFCS